VNVNVTETVESDPQNLSTDKQSKPNTYHTFAGVEQRKRKAEKNKQGNKRDRYIIQSKTAHTHAQSCHKKEHPERMKQEFKGPLSISIWGFVVLLLLLLLLLLLALCQILL
jgi:hypothetical protein